MEPVLTKWSIDCSKRDSREFALFLISARSVRTPGAMKFIMASVRKYLADGRSNRNQRPRLT